MARILIIEPHDDVRELLARIVTRLGHEHVRPEDRERDDAAVDAAILEPAVPGGLALARSLRREGVPLVLVSIEPAVPELLQLDVVAYLSKPFVLADLRRALALALASVDDPLAV